MYTERFRILDDNFATVNDSHQALVSILLAPGRDFRLSERVSIVRIQEYGVAELHRACRFAAKKRPIDPDTIIAVSSDVHEPQFLKHLMDILAMLMVKHMDGSMKDYTACFESPNTIPRSAVAVIVKMRKLDGKHSR